MEIRVFETKASLGAAAAERVGELLKAAVARKGYARIIFATGASQFEFLHALTSKPNIPWHKIEAFHLDEYVGIDESHPASFRLYLNQRLFTVVQPSFKAVHYLPSNAPNASNNPSNNPTLIHRDIDEYSAHLLSDGIDVACIGIGENTHLAFNDPSDTGGGADFSDAKQLKIVDLDVHCRQQQVDEGWFADLSAVPKQALTLTIPAILRADVISCVVPDARKAQAVYTTLMHDDISDCFPSTVLRTHPNCILWLDKHSASKCSPASLSSFHTTKSSNDNIRDNSTTTKTTVNKSKL